MKIRKGSTISWLLLFIVLFNLNLLYLIRVPYDSNIKRYISSILCLILFSIMSLKNYKVSYNYKFVRHYLLYVLLVQIIICTYSIYKYNESVKDMFMCAGGYITLWLFYIIIFIFENDGFEFLLNRVCNLQFCCTSIILLHCLIYNYTGISIFAITPTLFNNGRLRVSLGSLGGLFACYMFYRLLKGNHKNKAFIYVVIELIAIFYCETSRASEFAIVCSLIIMWLFNKDYSIKKIFKFEIALVSVVIAINSGLFNSILSNFSIDPNINEKAMSTLARYNAIEYFSKFTKANPLIGMGWVRPYTPSLETIWSGPMHKAFFDDLGFLGQYFRLGILGAMIYIALVVRMIYIVAKISKENEKNTFLIGLLSYVICTMISLNCFDSQRIFVVPFYLAIFEYVYKMDRINKSKEMG